MLCLFSFKRMIFLVLWSSIFGSRNSQTDHNSTNVSKKYKTERRFHSKIFRNNNLKVEHCGYDNRSRSNQNPDIQNEPINISETNQQQFSISAYKRNDGFLLNSGRPNNNACSIARRFQKPHNDIQMHCSSAKAIHPHVMQKSHSLLSIQPSKNVSRASNPCHEKLKQVFNSVQFYKKRSPSNLPPIEIFLCNNYLLCNFVKTGKEIQYLRFLRNICSIEKRLIESRPDFSRMNWKIFDKELDKVSIFTKNDEILPRITFLIHLKRFVKDNLKSEDISKRYCISMFLAIKSIESILSSTTIKLVNNIKRLMNRSISLICQEINDVLKESSTLITEIIFVVFPLGLNINNDFLRTLNLMKIGIRERNYNSFGRRFRENTNFSMDFVTDLIFLFTSEEIRKIANIFNLSDPLNDNFTNQLTYTPEDFCELEQLFSKREFVIKIIKYYLSIFSDTELQFLDTEVESELVKKQYGLLLKRFEAIISQENQNNENIDRNLHKLRLDTYYFFHFVLNYCYNHDVNSEKYLESLKKPYLKKSEQLKFFLYLFCVYY